MTTFKVGDIVVKSSPYNKNKYCRFGGEEYDVPINTQGKITHLYGLNVQVIFDNGKHWDVDISEISHLKITDWRSELK